MRQFEWPGGGGRAGLSRPLLRSRDHNLRRPGTFRNWLCSGYEPVSSPGKGLDVPRLIGGVAQCVAEPFYGRIDTLVEVHCYVIRPESVADVFPRNQHTGGLNQHSQDLERLFLKVYSTPGFVQLSSSQIEIVRTEADARESTVAVTACIRVTHSPLHVTAVSIYHDPGARKGMPAQVLIPSSKCHAPVIRVPLHSLAVCATVDSYAARGRCRWAAPLRRRST